MRLAYAPIRLMLKHPWVIANASRTAQKQVANSIVVTLCDDDGITGLGESTPSARYGESTQSATQFLGSLDPTQLSFDRIEESMSYLESVSRGEFSAKSAVNVALHDGAARKCGKSLHDLLGFGFREHSHTTSFSIGIGSPTDSIYKALEANDFPVIKLKVGSSTDRLSFEALRTVAPTKELRLDANEAWETKEEALENLEWYAEKGSIAFVEQPMPSVTPLRDLEWLKGRSPLPLVADESFRSVDDLVPAIAAFHGVNVKLSKVGGVSAAITALQAARTAGLKTMLGCMIETSIQISAAAHLADLCDYIDLDGNLLITNDPYEGVTVENGLLSFAKTEAKLGIRVTKRANTS